MNKLSAIVLAILSLSAEAANVNTKPTAITENGITFRGGEVMGTSAPVNVYFIWYGDWSNAQPVKTLVTDFGKNVGSSSFMNAVNSYYDANKSTIIPKVNYKGDTTVSVYPAGRPSYMKAIATNDYYNIVKDVTASGKLPVDTNGVYFIFSSADVAPYKFGSTWCGSHYGIDMSMADGSKKSMKYAIVGDPVAYMNACSANNNSPNNNPRGDAIVQFVAHELIETITDPRSTAWFDISGREVGDKCVWSFGSTKTASNGAKYNVTVGNKQYLLMQNWINASGGYCGL